MLFDTEFSPEGKTRKACVASGCFTGRFTDETFACHVLGLVVFSLHATFGL